MPLNIPGLLAPFQLLFRPRLALPSVVVKVKTCDVWTFVLYIELGIAEQYLTRIIVWHTLPYEDTLVPELKVAWEECKNTFGAENVLVVSNSAGSYLDPGGIEAESVSNHLGVPVLRHDTMKPGYACISAIRAYFASLPCPVPDTALFIVGDRIFTDVILANRMRPYERQVNKRALSDTLEKGTSRVDHGLQADNEPEGPLSIFVESVWKRDATAMRFLEKKLVDLIQRWNTVEYNELFVRS